MRKIIVFFLLLFVVDVYSQGNRNEYKTLIDSAIVIKANNLHKFYNEELKKDKWKSYVNNFKKNDVYVIDENNKPIILNFIKSKIALKTIDINDKKNRGLLKKGIKAWMVYPILNGNTLTISIIDFGIHYRGKKYNFINGGGSTIVFQYSCEDKKWKLVKEDHTGL